MTPACYATAPNPIPCRQAGRSHAQRAAGNPAPERPEHVRRRRSRSAICCRCIPRSISTRDPVFERIKRIKETARPKREYCDGWIPQPDVLLARLKEMQSVLVRTKAALNRGEVRFEEIVTAPARRSASSAEPATRTRLDALRASLTARRQRTVPRGRRARGDLRPRCLPEAARRQGEAHDRAGTNTVPVHGDTGWHRI